MIIRSPRRGPFMFIIFLIISVLVLLHRSRYLIGLLFEDGGRDSVNTFDLPQNTTLPLLIPKIIHQTYKTVELPAHWKKAQNATKFYHPDYEYKVRLPRDTVWSGKQSADKMKSSGLTKPGLNSSKLTTQLSFPPMLPTPIQFRGSMHCDTSSFTTMEASTST